MDIQSRKLEFIQEFLKIQSEDVISKFEQLLKNKNLLVLVPFTQEELENRVKTAERDFETGNYKTSSDLLAKFR